MLLGSGGWCPSLCTCIKVSGIAAPLKPLECPAICPWRWGGSQACGTCPNRLPAHEVLPKLEIRLTIVSCSANCTLALHPILYCKGATSFQPSQGVNNSTLAYYFCVRKCHQKPCLSQCFYYLIVTWAACNLNECALNCEGKSVESHLQLERRRREKHAWIMIRAEGCGMWILQRLLGTECFIALLCGAHEASKADNVGFILVWMNLIKTYDSFECVASHASSHR